MPVPQADEVVVRIEARPINPSDLGLLFGAADMSTARHSGSRRQPVVTARIPDALMKGMAGRLDQSMPVGNEGAGVVVEAGASDEAQALLGKTVAVVGGAMYSQYRSAKAAQCLVLPPEGTTAAEGASCFVNPLTSLGMVETMRREGHKALVHTAAASNLGQMLNKICIADGVGLVNIVRTRQQEDLLKAPGREPRVRLQRPDLHARPHRGARRHRRDPGLRCHRRRHAGRADPHLHGSRDQQNGQGVQPLRLARPTSRSTSTAAWTPARP